jgi:hypothetical protein
MNSTIWRQVHEDTVRSLWISHSTIWNEEMTEVCNAFISFIRSGPVATTLFLMMLLLAAGLLGCFGEEFDVEDDDDDSSSTSIAIFFPPVARAGTARAATVPIIMPWRAFMMIVLYCYCYFT